MDQHDKPKKRSIAVDFDGTLAFYDHYRGDALGDPIPEMVAKVKQAIEEGADVYIFTARVNPSGEFEDALSATKAQILIGQWCQRHLGVLLPITYEKSRNWGEIWDDRGIQVIPNTGVFLSELVDASSER